VNRNLIPGYAPRGHHVGDRQELVRRIIAAFPRRITALAPGKGFFPGVSAEVAFSKFRSLRIRGFHYAIKARSESKWFPGLPLCLWLGAQSGVLVQRLRNKDLGERTGVRLSWYYYLEDKIQFPFQAQCIASVPTSPLRKGDSVEIRKMAPEDSCSTDMLVMTRWNNRNIAVPLSQLKAIGVDESTTQAIEDWHYWVAQGSCF
jgi:hypothetical protein